MNKNLNYSFLIKKKNNNLSFSIVNENENKYYFDII